MILSRRGDDRLFSMSFVLQKKRTDYYTELENDGAGGRSTGYEIAGMVK
jgi:hypothetical protein